MTPVAWMRRRALEREINKLRLRLDGKRAAFACDRNASVGRWFQGTGLALASGFMNGVAAAGLPEQLDRANAIALLARAAAAAVIAAATYVTQHPPDALSPGDDAPQPGRRARKVEPVHDGGPELRLTEAGLMQRLREQTAGGGRP